MMWRVYFGTNPLLPLEENPRPPFLNFLPNACVKQSYICGAMVLYRLFHASLLNLCIEVRYITIGIDRRSRA